MKSVSLNPPLPNDALRQVFEHVLDEVQGMISYTIGSASVFIILGNRFFFRSDDYLGAALVAVTDKSGQRIDLGAAGKGQGLLGLTWGAGDKIENELLDSIKTMASHNSSIVKDVPASSGSTQK